MAKVLISFKVEQLRWLVNSECKPGEAFLVALHSNKDKLVGLLGEIEKRTSNKELELTISEVSPSKSVDANSYCWALLHKLSVVLEKSAVEIYKELIPDIGDNYEIVPILDERVDVWIDIWENKPKKKTGWVSKILGPSKLEGYTNTINYFGSSTFSSEQMSRFIKLVIQECESQEPKIETKTPNEIARLERLWAENKH